MDVDMEIDDYVPQVQSACFQPAPPSFQPAPPTPFHALINSNSTSQPAPTTTPEWVAPPDEDNIYRDGEGAWIVSNWDEESSTLERLQKFLNRWPPSRTPDSYCSWIAIDRGGLQKRNPDIPALMASFQELVAANAVTVEALDKISQVHNVLVGKWLIFEEPAKIDFMWGKLVKLLCLRMKRGSAKVAPRRGEDRHVICVYTQDYTNLEEVKALREALRSIGVRWKIGLKPDAYTYMGIYSKNAWNIRPSRYFE